MYVGVDVGGTKTLVTVFTDAGKKVESARFPTPVDYDIFKLELRHALAHFEHQDFQAAGAGMAISLFDRPGGIGRRFGNLPWVDVPIQHDLERILKCPVIIENDAKMASLSEALLLKGKYNRVLYVTVSTGIGYGLTVGEVIDDNIGDAGGRNMLQVHQGKLVPWESFASGKAIVRRYHKFAEDIHDEETWTKIVRDLKLGFLELIAVTQPDAIVVGGSVGNYFERYQQLLHDALKEYETPYAPLPALLKAKNPDEAVANGCYELAKRTFGHVPAKPTKGSRAKAA